MIRTLFLVAAFSIAFPAAPLRAAEPATAGWTLAGAYKLVKKLPLEDLASLLDDLGPGKSKPEVKARLKELVPQLSLRVHSAKLDVTVRDYTPGRMGRIEMELSMPADVEYTIDLRTLSPADLKWDSARKILKVKLPPVIVGNVAPRLDEETVEKPRFTGMRSWWFNGAAIANLERKLRKEDYRPAAKAEAEKRIPDAVRAGRDQVRDLLKKLLTPLGSDLVVIVE